MSARYTLAEIDEIREMLAWRGAWVGYPPIGPHAYGVWLGRVCQQKPDKPMINLGATSEDEVRTIMAAGATMAEVRARRAEAERRINASLDHEIRHWHKSYLAWKRRRIAELREARAEAERDRVYGCLTGYIPAKAVALWCWPARIERVERPRVRFWS